MFRWTLAGILVLAVAGALAVTTLTTRDSSATTVTAKPSSDPPWIAGSRMPRVRDGVASIRVHCGQAAPCAGTATLGNVAVPYRIAAGSDARLRFADLADRPHAADLARDERDDPVRLRHPAAELSRASAAVSASYIAITSSPTAGGSSTASSRRRWRSQRAAATRASPSAASISSRSSSPGGSAASTIGSQASAAVPPRGRGVPQRVAPQQARRLVEEVGVQAAQVRAVRGVGVDRRAQAADRRARRRTRSASPSCCACRWSSAPTCATRAARTSPTSRSGARPGVAAPPRRPRAASRSTRSGSIVISRCL